MKTTGMMDRMILHFTLFSTLLHQDLQTGTRVNNGGISDVKVCVWVGKFEVVHREQVNKDLLERCRCVPSSRTKNIS